MKDKEIFEQFLERWKAGSLGSDDPIVRMVNQKGRKVTSSWNCSDWADDLINETLLKLSKGEYRADGSLEGFIARLMANEVKQHWRKERGNLKVELREDIPAPESFNADIEVSDRVMRLIAKTPQQFWWYLEFVADFEGYASERDAAKYAKVTRHQIQKIKEQIRKIWSAMERAKASGIGD